MPRTIKIPGQFVYVYISSKTDFQKEFSKYSMWLHLFNFAFEPSSKLLV